ncbi:hypothetical protein [Microbacterium sp. YY-01]|uniref:hypothetical protein n=1 Tax=Microbacterium sp. YY-01 TaxID=3421634 RepID=UPI003D167431
MDWRWLSVKLRGERVKTAPDFVVYDHLLVVGYDDRENKFQLELRFSESEGRYYVRQISLRAASEKDEITGARLRELPLLKLSRNALAEGYLVELQSGGIFDPQTVSDAADSIVAGGPSSDEAMLATARIYRYSQILQRRPAKAVQNALGLTAPTATLWIRRARSLGLLGDYGESTDG